MQMIYRLNHSHSKSDAKRKLGDFYNFAYFGTDTPSPSRRWEWADYILRGLFIYYKMLTKFETKSPRVKGLSFHPKRPWVLARYDSLNAAPLHLGV
ncbi:Coatomer subunit alpha [Armadillidium vulgare]|nr:Coatomer subunit alpha [Armadillidium vulgare]